MQGPVKKFPLLRQDAVDSDNSDSVLPGAEPENTSNNMINPELTKDMQPVPFGKAENIYMINPDLICIFNTAPDDKPANPDSLKRHKSAEDTDSLRRSSRPIIVGGSFIFSNSLDGYVSPSLIQQYESLVGAGGGRRPSRDPHPEVLTGTADLVEESEEQRDNCDIISFSAISVTDDLDEPAEEAMTTPTLLDTSVKGLGKPFISSHKSDIITFCLTEVGRQKTLEEEELIGAVPVDREFETVGEATPDCTTDDHPSRENKDIITFSARRSSDPDQAPSGPSRPLAEPLSEDLQKPYVSLNFSDLISFYNSQEGLLRAYSIEPQEEEEEGVVEEEEDVVEEEEEGEPQQNRDKFVFTNDRGEGELPAPPAQVVTGTTQAGQGKEGPFMVSQGSIISFYSSNEELARSMEVLDSDQQDDRQEPAEVEEFEDLSLLAEPESNRDQFVFSNERSEVSPNETVSHIKPIAASTPVAYPKKLETLRVHQGSIIAFYASEESYISATETEDEQDAELDNKAEEPLPVEEEQDEVENTDIKIFSNQRNGNIATPKVSSTPSIRSQEDTPVLVVTREFPDIISFYNPGKGDTPLILDEVPKSVPQHTACGLIDEPVAGSRTESVETAEFGTIELEATSSSPAPPTKEADIPKPQPISEPAKRDRQINDLPSNTKRPVSTQPKTPEPVLQSKPRTPEPVLQSKPRTPEPVLQSKPRTPEPVLQSKPRTPEPVLQSKPKTPEPPFKRPVSYKPKTPEPEPLPSHSKYPKKKLWAQKSVDLEYDLVEDTKLWVDKPVEIVDMAELEDLPGLEYLPDALPEFEDEEDRRSIVIEDSMSEDGRPIRNVQAIENLSSIDRAIDIVDAIRDVDSMGIIDAPDEDVHDEYLYDDDEFEKDITEELDSLLSEASRLMEEPQDQDTDVDDDDDLEYFFDEVAARRNITLEPEDVPTLGVPGLRHTPYNGDNISPRSRDSLNGESAIITFITQNLDKYMELSPVPYLPPPTAEITEITAGSLDVEADFDEVLMGELPDLPGCDTPRAQSPARGLTPSSPAPLPPRGLTPGSPAPLPPRGATPGPREMGYSGLSGEDSPSFPEPPQVIPTSPQVITRQLLRATSIDEDQDSDSDAEYKTMYQALNRPVIPPIGRFEDEDDGRSSPHDFYTAEPDPARSLTTPFGGDEDLVLSTELLTEIVERAAQRDTRVTSPDPERGDLLGEARSFFVKNVVGSSSVDTDNESYVTTKSRKSSDRSRDNTGSPIFNLAETIKGRLALHVAEQDKRIVKSVKPSDVVKLDHWVFRDLQRKFSKPSKERVSSLRSKFRNRKRGKSTWVPVQVIPHQVDISYKEVNPVDVEVEIPDIIERRTPIARLFNDTSPLPRGPSPPVPTSSRIVSPHPNVFVPIEGPCYKRRYPSPRILRKVAMFEGLAFIDSKRRPVSPGPESKYLGSQGDLSNKDDSVHDCECDPPPGPKLTRHWASQDSGLYDGTLRPAHQRKRTEMFQPSWRRSEQGAERSRSTSPHWQSFSEAAFGAATQGTSYLESQVPPELSRCPSRVRNLSSETTRESKIVQQSMGSQTNTHVDRLARSGSAASLAVVMASTFPSGGDANFDLEGTAAKISQVCKSLSSSQTDVSSYGSVNLTRSRSLNSGMHVEHDPEVLATPPRPLYFDRGYSRPIKLRTTPESRVAQPVMAKRTVPYKVLKELQEKYKDAETIPFEDLIRLPKNRLPHHFDKLKLENYLPDEDFETVFKMTKVDFQKLPGWKQSNLKKEKHLF